MTLHQIRNLIRDVPDFPRPGVVFKDITPLLANPQGFDRTVELLADSISRHGSESIVAIESRGFIFAAPVAARTGLPLHLVRKAGKLPFESVGIEYELEYGRDKLEVHVDVIDSNTRYAIVDDVIATGGTAAATGQLLQDNGGSLACYAFVIELAFLNGRQQLGDAAVESLLTYD